MENYGRVMGTLLLMEAQCECDRKWGERGGQRI